MCRTTVNVGADLVTATIVDDQLKASEKPSGFADAPLPPTE
jgi:hypothetical protein